MTQNLNPTRAYVSDWLEVGRPPGTLARRARVLDVLGVAGHTHLRVPVDEEGESLFYPTDGAVLVHPLPRRDDDEAGT